MKMTRMTSPSAWPKRTLRRPVRRSWTWITHCTPRSPSPQSQDAEPPSPVYSESKDLAKLSSLGHFLKGSSAALGVSAVQASCEDIQHYGALRDEEHGTDLTETDALAKIGPLLKRVKREYAVAERWLQNWYKEHVVPAED